MANFAFVNKKCEFYNIVMRNIFIAGPCVIENEKVTEAVAAELVRLNKLFGIDIIFKSSFDKANRTSLSSYRGPGLEKGLEVLAGVKKDFGLKVLTDIHESMQAEPVGKVVDVIQIPCLSLPPDRPYSCGCKDGKNGEHQESAVSFGRRHEISL